MERHERVTFVFSDNEKENDDDNTLQWTVLSL
jgi:hypothetical protein